MVTEEKKEDRCNRLITEANGLYDKARKIRSKKERAALEALARELEIEAEEVMRDTPS